MRVFLPPLTLLLPCLVLTGVSSARAQAEGMSLDRAVQTALRDNRELQAARFTLAQAQARLRQAGRWAHPELEVSSMSDFAFANKGEAALSVTFSQAFPLTSRLSLQRQIGRLDVERARREVRNHERLLAGRVRALYIRVVAAKARAELWKRAKRQQDAISEVVAKRLELGQGSAAEAALAAATQAATDGRLSEAETGAESELIELKTLLGLSAEHPLQLADPLPRIIELLKNQTGERPAVLQRPDAELLLLEADRAALESRLARAEAWEDVRIGVEYTADRAVDEPDGLETGQFLGVKISLPLPLWNTNAGAVAEKQALRAELQSRLGALQLEIANELASALRRTRLLENRLAQIRARGIEPVREHENKLRQAFEEGRADLRDLLTVRAQLAELEVAEVTAQAELAEAYARLATAVGAEKRLRD